MMKIIFLILTTSIFVLLLKPSTAVGQTIFAVNNCENNLALLENIRALPLNDTQIIVIAYRGKNENSTKYSLGSLKEIKKVLGDKRPVFAIGEKPVTKPKVEIYVNGKLDLVFEMKNREILRTQLCGELY
jgi:hypothetical protein